MSLLEPDYWKPDLSSLEQWEQSLRSLHSIVTMQYLCSYTILAVNSENNLKNWLLRIGLPNTASKSEVYLR